MDDYKEAFRLFGTTVTFEAGTRICDRETPLTAAYLIESGYATASDHVYVDIARLGLVLERGDAFGAYAFFERPEMAAFSPPSFSAHGHAAPSLPSLPPAEPPYPVAPPELRAYPSFLRALTKVTARALDDEAYRQALAQEPRLERWLREQIVLTEYLAQVIYALRGRGELRRLPGFEITQMVKQGKAIQLARDEEHVVAKGSWAYVAWGLVTVCDGGWSLGSGQLLQSGAGKPLKAASDNCWIIEIPEQQGALAAASGGAPKPRLVMLWSKTVPPKVVSALTAHLAAVQQGEAGRPDRWKGGLLIVDGPSTTTAAQQGSIDAGVAFGRTAAADLAAGIAALNTPVVYLDVSGCSDDFVRQTIAPQVTTLVVVGGSPADVPATFSACDFVPCAILPNRPDRGVGAFASSVERFLRSAYAERFQDERRANAAEYVPRTVRLSFADADELPVLSRISLPTADRESVERIARAVARRRVGLALGGGGGWGYAHIAFLDELEKRRMPIDAISGVSFGSLVGGYYSVRNLDYTRTLIGDWAKLLASQLGAALLPPVLEWFLLRRLQGTYLEDLQVPFFPVCLNLQSGQEYTPPRGSVAFGVRASSSLPGFLSPAIGIKTRGIDGAFINNVPEGVLEREGIHFILASSVVQAPDPGPEPKGPFSWSINPLQRMQDSMRGTGWLMKVADERDADRARWRFEPFRKDLLRGIQAWALWKGAEIQRRVQREAQDIAGRAHRDWLRTWA